MSNNDINKIKATIHKKIKYMNDETLLQMEEEGITTYRTAPSKDIIDELTPEQQQRLQESIQQADNGQTIQNEEVKQKAKEWLSR
jgi:hypothetical protein